VPLPDEASLQLQARASKPPLFPGAVAWAGGGRGPDFLISLSAHAEWGRDHVVFGHVDDLSSLAPLLARPRAQKQWGATAVSLFAEPVPFAPHLLLHVDHSADHDRLLAKAIADTEAW
jgi:hypothetical protein